jgi:hypothetical protein
MGLRHPHSALLAFGFFALLTECSAPRGTKSEGISAAKPTSPASLPTPATSTEITPASSTVADAEPSVHVAAPRETGPFELPFAPKRTVYFTIPATTKRRLIANIHGVCNPPGYACGYWTHSAKAEGFLVCPTGDGSCGGAYNPPTWNGGDAAVDHDLESSIAVVDAAYPNEMERDGAILTGFSRGAFLAPKIAAMHPGRWPYLILNEANVSLDIAQLRAAKVRAVAMIAGEIGGAISGERATVKKLRAAGFPAELFVMPKAGHYYSDNIDEIMSQAIAFVLAQK